MADLRTVLRIIAKDETKGALTKTQAELKGIGTTLGQLRNQALALAGVNFGVGGLAQLISLADGYALTTSRLKLLSGETENFAAVQKEVFEIAQSTFTTYEQTASIYGNLAASTKEVGVSSKELLVVTKALNQSYLISGSTQQEAKASTLQLVQALASGQIRGQEFNSVAEQGRRILFALKDATGLTAGALRQFANEGKLTTDFFLKAFLPQAEKINEEFDTLPLTVGRALTQLQNEFERFVGEQNKELGITRDIALAFQDLTANFESFAKAVVTSGGVAVAYLTTQFLAALGKSTEEKLKSASATLLTAKNNKVAALSVQNLARAEYSAATASRARLSTLLASEQAALRANVAANASLTERAILEQRITFLKEQSVIATNAQTAAEARLAVASRAVAASSVAASLATRAWAGALALLGGPFGATLTALAAVAAGVYYYNTQVSRGTNLLDEWNEAQANAKKIADAQASSIDNITTAMEKLTYARQVDEIKRLEAAIRQTEESIGSLETQIVTGVGDIFDPISGIAAPEDLRVLEEYREKADVAKKKLKELQDELARLVKRDRDLENELGDSAISGIPKKLSDSLEDQKKANTELQNIEARRRKLIDNLDKLSAELSGPQIDVEKQSDAFNIAALNTIRGQIQGDIQAGEADKAVANLEKAKIIIEQLQKTGGASKSYLKTQVDLIKTLTKEAGDIDVTPKVNEDKLIDELVKEKSIADQFREQNPSYSETKFKEEQVRSATLAAINVAVKVAKDNPIPLNVITSGSRTLGLGDLPANAAGGHIRGPGSGTSDSILSWLSNGEYVMRAAVVRHYGTDFMDRLNRMVLPKFASGGAVRVPGAAPPASSGAPIIFNLNGSQYEATISGGGVGDLRSALNRENMRRGTRA